MRLSIFVTTLALFLLVGCAGPGISQYGDASPQLDVREYFNGELDAWGVVKDRGGNVTRRFYATIKGSWQSNQGTLDETFHWSDGKQERRVWKLIVLDDNHFSGTAHDVVGTAFGQQRGNAVQMRYVLRVPTDAGSSIDVAMDDWMYRITDKELINETTMRKFGVRVGSILIGFRKR